MKPAKIRDSRMANITDIDFAYTSAWVFVARLLQQERFWRGEYPPPGSWEFMERGRN